jgi:hypothetical protein
LAPFLLLAALAVGCGVPVGPAGVPMATAVAEAEEVTLEISALM